MSQKIQRISLFLLCVVQVAKSQYKAPLYMGFLMPKKYTRNFTNMQQKPKVNCGSFCPQQQIMIGNSFTNNLDQSMDTQQQFQTLQFNSYGPTTNPSTPLINSNNDLKVPNWEKQVQAFNNNNNNNNNYAPKTDQAVKFVCCNAQNGGQQNGQQNTFNSNSPSNQITSFNSNPSQTFTFSTNLNPQQSFANQNTYTNSFNRPNNLYNKPQWDTLNQANPSSPSTSFDQWIRQQPQDSPFVLYTGSQMEQRQQTPFVYGQLDKNDQFPNGQFNLMGGQGKNYYKSQLGFD